MIIMIPQFITDFVKKKLNIKSALTIGIVSFLIYKAVKGFMSKKESLHTEYSFDDYGKQISNDVFFKIANKFGFKNNYEDGSQAFVSKDKKYAITYIYNNGWYTLQYEKPGERSKIKKFRDANKFEKELINIIKTKLIESWEEKLQLLKEEFNATRYKVGDCKKASEDYIKYKNDPQLQLLKLHNAFMGAAQIHYVVIDKSKNEIIDLTFKDYVTQLKKHPILKPTSWMLKHERDFIFDASNYINHYKGE